jgi:FMN phosphatase YigB (HAD superfamily)
MNRPITVAIDYGVLTTHGLSDQASYPPVDPEAAQVLRRLRRDRYRLILTTNTGGRSRQRELTHAGIGGVFHEKIESHDVGADKPARTFFQALLDMAGCPPDQLINVGPLWDADVLVPLRVGVRRAVYVSPYLDPHKWLPPGAEHVRRFHDLPELLVQSLMARQ